MGAIHKDWDKVKVRSVLLFPEIYEIGMSSLGFQILYQIINRDTDFLAERAYLPWTDMMAKMGEYQIPLYALESFTPLNDFDVVATTLQYETGFTNVLQCIHLAGQSVLAKERAETFPLWIGGGPCAVNPEPMADFLDAFVLGDGEEVFLELLETVRTAKESSHKNLVRKQDLLRRLAGIPGVYVPSLYAPSYQADRTLASLDPVDDDVPKTVRRRAVKDISKDSQPQRIVPLLNIIHDRLGIELFRGCTRGCRFCQPGMVSRPVRECSPANVEERTLQALGLTGYEEVTFSSLSSGDYSGLKQFIPRIMIVLSKSTTAVSLP